MPQDARVRIREAREARLMSQEELALKAGISHRTVLNIERGTMSPRLDTRKRVLEVLGIPVEQHYEIWGPLPRR